MGAGQVASGAASGAAAGAMGGPVGIAVGAGIGALGSIFGAKQQSKGTERAAQTQTQSSNYAADRQAEASARTEAFLREQAQNAYQNSEATRRANYDQWAASRRDVGRYAQRYGYDAPEVPGYVGGVDPRFMGGGGPGAPVSGTQPPQQPPRFAPSDGSVGAYAQRPQVQATQPQTAALQAPSAYDVGGLVDRRPAMRRVNPYAGSVDAYLRA